MKFQIGGSAVSAIALAVAMAMPAPAEATNLRLEAVAEGLQHPLMLVQPDGDDRRFIVEQPGRIRILADDNFLLDEPFLNIEHKVVDLMSTFDERGLLGVAFHPDFDDNGRFFVYYSGHIPGESALDAHLWYSHTNYVAEYRVDPDNPNRADHRTERVLMSFDWPQFNHNGGWLGFGEDGYLYISTGDGGYANDWGIGHHVTMGNGQYLGTHLGKILRIDVDVDEDEYYSVPDDNPFADDAQAMPEIWAYGFRNPWRCSFDHAAEVEGLICADVGQDAYEMVKLIQGGENHGWRVKEGSHCFDFESPNDHPEECDDAGMIDPIMEYQNCNVFPDCEGISITGGYIARNGDDLDGAYIFGDWSARFDVMDGRLFVGRQNGDDEWEMETAEVEDMDTLPYMLAFGQDADGAVYALTTESLGPVGQLDKVYRISSANGDPVDDDDDDDNDDNDNDDNDDESDG